jgi:N-acetylglucosaminyl-diphospho-decaprenol L-rhamnosyltransferase
MSPQLSIIIVSYNTRDITLACLGSVYAQTRETTFEVIVLDNASTDGSADAIAEKFPQVQLIRHPSNLGFAGGNNLAAKRAAGEYLLLLNPDTVVLNGAIDTLMAFAKESPGAGIWGGRTVFADGTLNPTYCWKRQTPWSAFCCGSGLSSLFRGSRVLDPEAMGAWNRDPAPEVDIVSGCFLLITRALWDTLGGFDPAFFMYGEEADMCLRARGHGARPRITTAATIVHLGGASEKVRSDKLVRLLKAKTLLIRRHWSSPAARFGVAMLTFWPLSRVLAWSLLAPLRGGAGRESARVWSGVWQRRREWLDQPLHAQAPAPGAPSHA